MGVTEGALSFLFDPFVKAREVVMMHTLNFGNFLPIFDFIKADCTIFLPYIIDDFPLYPILIGFSVLLPEEKLIGDSQSEVECIVK